MPQLNFAFFAWHAFDVYVFRHSRLPSAADADILDFDLIDELPIPENAGYWRNAFVTGDQHYRIFLRYICLGKYWSKYIFLETIYRHVIS